MTQAAQATQPVEVYKGRNIDFGDEPEANIDRSMIEVAQTRAAQEVQAAMIVAKRHPRNMTDAYAKIIQSCKRKTLAEQALYAYPKGGQTVTGPSIRLAEAMAQAWGNLDFGVIELEQKNGESVVMSYAWDLETNTRQTKIFTVKHERHTKSGNYSLKDPRDIYEMTANQGARRLRSCILGIIPGDVVDAAVEQCHKTLAGGDGEPLIDRIRKMTAAFLDIGVSQEMIEKRLRHKIETTAETELVTLRAIFRSIKDNMQGVESYFETGAPRGTSGGVGDKLNGANVHKTVDPDTQPPAPEDPPVDQESPEHGDVQQELSQEPTGFEAFKIAQWELAEALGCPRDKFEQTLSRWVLGLKPPMKGKEDSIDKETLAKCSSALATKAGVWAFLK